MHEHITPKQHIPTHKFHKILKYPKNFQKPQNLGLKFMNAWKMKVLGHLPSDLILVEAKKAMGREIWVREKCLGRERRENEIWFRTQPLNRNRSLMDRSICQVLILNRNEFVEVLSRIFRRQKYLDGSRSCRESIGQTENFSMDQETLEKLSRQISESLMDRN